MTRGACRLAEREAFRMWVRRKGGEGGEIAAADPGGLDDADVEEGHVRRGGGRQTGRSANICVCLYSG